MKTSRINSLFKTVLTGFACLAALSQAMLGYGQAGQRPNLGPQTTESIGGATISPMIYRIATVAGRSSVISFDVTGSPRAQTDITVRLWSATFEEGTYKALLGTQHDRDCSKWFIGKSEITQRLKRNERKTLSIPYRIPTGATGVYWAVLTFNPKPVGSNDGVQLQYEVPVIFTVGNPGRPELRVATPEIYVQEKSAGIMLRVSNVSKHHAVVGASAEIRSALAGTLIQKLSISDRNILPKTSRDLVLTLDKPLKDGTYKVIAHADLGVRKLPNIRADFVVAGGKVKMLTPQIQHELTPVVVDPGGFDIIVSPGGQAIKSISFLNTSDKPITIELTPRNVEQSDSGAIGAGEGAIPSGLGVTIAPSLIEMAPKGRYSARLTVTTDKGAVGDKWFSVSVVEKDNPKAFSQQLLAVVSLKNTLTSKVEVENLEAKKDSRGNMLQIIWDLVNTGNSNVAPSIEATLFDKAGNKAAIIEPKVPAGGQMIPGVRFRGQALLPPYLQAGSYEFLLKVQYSEKGIIERRVPITILGTGSSQKP